MKKILENLKLFLSKKFKNFKWAAFFLFTILILVPASLFLIYSFSISTQYIWMGNISSTFVVTLLLIIITILLFSIFAEILFRLYFYLVHRKTFVPSERVRYDKLYVEPSPYIPYKFKPLFRNEKEALADYPLQALNRIKLNHSIDNFTDTHSIFKECFNELFPINRHFSRVIIDVRFDFF